MGRGTALIYSDPTVCFDLATLQEKNHQGEDKERNAICTDEGHCLHRHRAYCGMQGIESCATEQCNTGYIGEGPKKKGGIKMDTEEILATLRLYPRGGMSPAGPAAHQVYLLLVYV